MTTQLFLPKFRIDECLDEIRVCLEKGWTGVGFKTVEFEKEWSSYSGLTHSHFLNSATSGLHLAMHIFKAKYKWSDGDEVITSPLTFVSTNHAILYENLTPVFADVDESLCLDPASIESRITQRTRAVIFVGMGGNPGRLADVVKLCRERNLILILDAAHMAGTRLNERHVGYDVDCAVFSFQAVKNLPTADSGMICFREESDDQLARKLSWLGINKDTYARTGQQGNYRWLYDVEHVGFKYHGNSIMAALALVGLKYLDTDNQYRRQLCDIYDRELLPVQEIKRIPMAEDCVPSRHLYQIRVKDRDTVLNMLAAHNIFAGVHYRDNTEYRMYANGRHACPNARSASEELISLPLHMSLSEQDTVEISRLIVAHYRGH